MTRSGTRAVLLAATAALALPRLSQAVIFVSTGDNTYNTTAPTGAQANSGWQWEGDFGGFYTGTPISTHAFLAAQHIGQDVGAVFTFNNVQYTTTAFTDVPNTDLRIWQVDGILPTYAPLWNTATDGTEVGKPLVVIGRGTERGDPILVPQTTGTVRGWLWGADTHVLRWGQNIVTKFADWNAQGDNKMLYFTFDASGTGNSGVNEAVISQGDSSGGTFIQSGNQWKLAGINYGVDGPFSYNANGANTFLGAIYDATGLYYCPQTTPPTQPQLVQSSGGPVPIGLLTRVSPQFASLMPFLSPTWNIDGGSVWNNSAAWQAGMIPSGVDSEANFRGAISLSRTVTVDSPRTVGNIYFDNTAHYTLGGTSTISMAVSSGSAGITVYSGSPTISAPVSMVSNTNINVVQSTSTLTLSGGLSASGTAALTKQGAGTLTLPNVRLSGLTLSGGVVHILPGRTSGGTSVLASAPVITGGAQLDLEDNALIVNYGANDNNATRDAIRSLLANGRNAGPGAAAPWNGLGGITSTFAHNNGNGFNLAIGYADNAVLAGVGAGSYSTFGGQTVTPNTILVQMTYGGDANLDGKVDGVDVSIIGTQFNKPGSGQWYYGDFDYSGMVDGNDVSVLGSTFGKTSPTLSPAQLTAEFGSAFASAFEQGQSSAVPEPAAGAILGIASIALLRRRRRR